MGENDEDFNRPINKRIIDDNAKSIHDGCMIQMAVDEALHGASAADI